MKRVALSWSSGKDSAWTLHLLRQDLAVEVVALVTTLNQEFDRVAMHAGIASRECRHNHRLLLNLFT